MENQETKACPFCGGPAEVRPREDYYDFRVFCKDEKCGCSSPKGGRTFEEAQEWWNRRAGDRQPMPSETGGTKGVGMSDLLSGAGLIASERLRQKQQEGYSDEHDDEHVFAEIVEAAICYADHAAMHQGIGAKDYRNYDAPDDWPWDYSAWKPKSPIEDLVRAGALIAAEIDRLKRLKASKPDNARADLPPR
jgi:hypothetical protein